MLKLITVGGIVLGAGVVTGLSVVGWMYFNQPDAPSIGYLGGPVVLDMSTTPQPTSQDNLQVAGPTSVAANGGNADTLLGGTGRGASNNTSKTSSKELPLPNEFQQYEIHKDKPTSLFIDVVVGQGKDIVLGSTASVMYRGYLTDGTLFDETYSRGQAFSFKEGDRKVITGWEEGMFGMKAGGKRRLIVPAARAYGTEIKGPIPANSMLIFDVELISVQ